MEKTKRFRGQHEEIMQLAGKLSPYLHDRRLLVEHAPAARLVVNHVVGKLTVHLVMEDQSLYPELMRCGTPEAREMAQRFHREMGGIGRAISSFSARWTINEIRAAPSGFTEAAEQVLRVLSRRIRAENDLLYPMYDRGTVS